MERLIRIHIKLLAVVLLFLLPCLRVAKPHLPVDQWRSRSKADWIRLWNTERHVNVCNENLQPVFDAACQYDVRKVTKRTGEEFVKEWTAKDFLIGSKRKRGLNEECCHEDTGCVWEEVAEYCKQHGREKHKPGSPMVPGMQGR